MYLAPENVLLNKRLIVNIFWLQMVNVFCLTLHTNLSYAGAKKKQENPAVSRKLLTESL